MAAVEAAGPDLMGWLSFINLPNMDIGHVPINIYDPADITYSTSARPCARRKNGKRPVSLQPICPRRLNVRCMRVKVQADPGKAKCRNGSRRAFFRLELGWLESVHLLSVFVGFKRQEPRPLPLLHTFSYFSKLPLLAPCSVERACTWPTQACL